MLVPRRIEVDVRVIAATHSDLARMVAEGTFREDLFYRLNVIPVQLPALRERRDDIPLLVQHFLEKLGSEQVPPRHVTMSQDALRRLMAYAWPGNVRQLRNIIERVLILNPQARRIEKKHLPVLVHRATRRPDEFESLQHAREAYEREFILRKIEESNGNMSRAAEALGLERSHLYRKMKTLGIGAEMS